VLATTINSYLYQQYADDDDLQAFVAAYNQATQTYVDWFNNVGLPFYPGLDAPLLDWVAQGLYGLARTSLASPSSTSLGMLNTQMLNVAVLNGYTPSTTAYYNVSDDVFKRILTWNFYKGDGKRFCARWLKRRIMRFIVGENGLDPQPNQPGFVIGAENTSAIGVHISGSVLTVTINQTMLSSLVQVTPGVLTLFQLAFQDGALDLPLQYTYAVSIISSLTAVMTPATETSTGTALSQTTGAAGVLVYAGSGSYTYAWTWAYGGTGISINSPSVASTSFTASGMVWGQTYSGLALCTVTDTVSSLTATASCTVTINCIAPPELLAENGNWLLTESGIPIVLEP
jgi:hypothetical protein